MRSILIEKQNRSRAKLSRVALIGFRATGKTTIGEKLARILQYDFMDMDTEISRREKSSIEEMVRERGWSYFRKLESSLLGELATKNRIIISTGGGIILHEQNRVTLRKHFFVVWLKASPETIKKRLAEDLDKQAQRPPLSDKNLLDEVDEILQKRLTYYKETAHFCVSTDMLSPANVTEQIIKRFKENTGFGCENCHQSNP